MIKHELKTLKPYESYQLKYDRRTFSYLFKILGPVEKKYVNNQEFTLTTV